MNEKKYLKWYNKLGYGSGDLAANCIYGLLTSFVMIYLTDTVGLNAGIIGTLIMFSKFADGITDVFFGNMIDKTHTKLGKARPWMLYAEIGNCILLVAVFAIPMSWGAVAQYAYFFIAYTLLNAVFYTANNIAYASLTSLITKNNNERVQMGSIRFMFALVANITIMSITVNLVQSFGGGAAGWRTVAIIYAVISLIVNTISVFSVKELSEEELSEGAEEAKHEEYEKVSFVESLKLLLSNKYFLMIAGFYILMYIQTGISGIGIYYMTYVLGNPALLGTFSVAQMLPMVFGLALTPALVKKFGIYKSNLFGYALAIVFRLGFIVAGYMKNIPLMLVAMALSGLCTSPVTGDINALISSASEYTVRTKGKHIEGAMFSCSSLGIKVGGGLGSAISGMLLAASGYVANAAEQSATTINMMNFMYLWFPLISITLITVIMYFLKVEKANADWDAEHGVK
ncbi:MAG: MFS transporter [Clostridiales bacterium]|nr:MFS transporter [Roseburia sp.]MDD7636738.1 MFS transporter [Clostridiales bacterium]MDY4113859.1 MFS transporter [Roseburia sp.]